VKPVSKSVSWGARQREREKKEEERPRGCGQKKRGENQLDTYEVGGDKKSSDTNEGVLLTRVDKMRNIRHIRVKSCLGENGNGEATVKSNIVGGKKTGKKKLSLIIFRNLRGGGGDYATKGKTSKRRLMTRWLPGITAAKTLG